MDTYKADVIIAGGGIAGIVTAIELLEKSHKVLILERDTADKFGGLAKESFGGMFFVNTPEQRRTGIKDSPELALRDWFSFAEFGENDHLPKKWAEQYVHLCTGQVYKWLRKRGVSYFPVVHWVERGLYKPGNSVPRFHMVWGTGHGLAVAMIDRLNNHPKAATHLGIRYSHKVADIITETGAVKGVKGTHEINGTPFEAYADVVVIASGGINGSIERVKENWYKPWGEPPEIILNGSHRFADGVLHDAAEKINANLTHMDKMWNYAAGVHHPQPDKPHHGLSLVPPKSAIWLDYTGKRFGPVPLITAYDTRFLVETICKQPVKYSWQIMNMAIANKEFAISGSEHNAAIRNKSAVGFLKTILTGNKELVEQMLHECKDFVLANSLEELVTKMNALTGENHVKLEHVRDAIEKYDANIDRGPKFHNDEQLRRIAHTRQYRGDKVRTCNFQKIYDEKALPLIAIREFIVSRKSLGGIQTDLQSRVLTQPDAAGKQHAIEGLYAVGECAGFGGGGMHGLRALEGTFLGGCVLSARAAARSINAGKQLKG